jgi:DNA-binding CsgD family transcriptional regulator
MVDAASAPLPIQVRKIALHLQGLAQNRLDFDALLREVFSILHADIPFHSGWFATVDSLFDGEQPKLNPWCYEAWRDAAPLPKMRRIHSGQNSLLPTANQMLQNGHCVSRGTDWWAEDRLTTHPFYHAMLRPARLYRPLFCLLVDREKHCRGYLVVWREKNDPDFSQTDVLLMESLAPVISDVIKKQAAGGRLSVTDTETIDSEELQLLVRRRTPPGTLILDANNQVIYSNGHAKKIVGRFPAATDRPSAFPLPDTLLNLCDRLRALCAETMPNALETAAEINQLAFQDGGVYLFRALRLDSHDEATPPMRILVLLERVSQRPRVDRILHAHQLTQREQEVCRLLLDGKTNREVGNALNVGEYTVKSHMKRIMAKLQVGTRAGIVAKILQSSAQESV